MVFLKLARIRGWYLCSILLHKFTNTSTPSLIFLITNSLLLLTIIFSSTKNIMEAMKRSRIGIITMLWASYRFHSRQFHSLHFLSPPTSRTSFKKFPKWSNLSFLISEMSWKRRWPQQKKFRINPKGFDLQVLRCRDLVREKKIVRKKLTVDGSALNVLSLIFSGVTIVSSATSSEKIPNNPLRNSNNGNVLHAIIWIMLEEGSATVAEKIRSILSEIRDR